MHRPEPTPVRPHVPLPDRDLLAEQLLEDLEVAILTAPDDEPILRLWAAWEDLKRGLVR
ncbi:MAG: hypothetical protein LCH87_16010 [Actinobacteria bacterium]|nr:hypothetical protein [Actinomycetota bacterium]